MIKDIKELTLKNKKGITLVALVVTIILLLILASISLSILTGENGLIGMAKKSGKDMETASGEEQDKLNSLYSQLLIASNSSADITVNREQLVNVIEEVVDRKMSDIYPVGSVYINMGETNPADLFGGTWEKIEDRFLLASGTNTLGSTGGSATRTYTPSGTVQPHQLTVSEMPSHSHVQNGVNAWGHTQSFFGNYYGNAWRIWYYPNDVPTSYTISSNESYANENGSYKKVMLGADGTSGNTGGSGSHSHEFTGTQASIDTMPPYVVVNVWKRVA